MKPPHGIPQNAAALLTSHILLVILEQLLSTVVLTYVRKHPFRW
jgi:hypothetical protein